MNLIPMGDHVVVRRPDPNHWSTAGLHLRESVRGPSLQGGVLSVGDGKRLPNGTRLTHDAQEGEGVLFSRCAGTEIEIDGEPLLIPRVEDILTIVP